MESETINDIYFYELSDIILKNQSDFLEYEKWLFKNGTNVSKDLVLKKSKSLFPINSRKWKSCRLLYVLAPDWLKLGLFKLFDKLSFKML